MMMACIPRTRGFEGVSQPSLGEFVRPTSFFSHFNMPSGGIAESLGGRAGGWGKLKVSPGNDPRKEISTHISPRSR